MPETRTTKAASTQGADSAGSELVTMATLRELLKVQERMFKNLFDSLLANVNARRHRWFQFYPQTSPK